MRWDTDAYFSALLTLFVVVAITFPPCTPRLVQRLSQESRYASQRPLRASGYWVATVLFALAVGAMALVLSIAAPLASCCGSSKHLPQTHWHRLLGRTP